MAQYVRCMHSAFQKEKGDFISLNIVITNEEDQNKNMHNPPKKVKIIDDTICWIQKKLIKTFSYVHIVHIVE